MIFYEFFFYFLRLLAIYLTHQTTTIFITKNNEYKWTLKHTAPHTAHHGIKRNCYVFVFHFCDCNNTIISNVFGWKNKICIILCLCSCATIPHLISENSRHTFWYFRGICALHWSHLKETNMSRVRITQVECIWRFQVAAVFLSASHCMGRRLPYSFFFYPYLALHSVIQFKINKCRNSKANNNNKSRCEISIPNAWDIQCQSKEMRTTALYTFESFVADETLQ